MILIWKENLNSSSSKTWKGVPIIASNMDTVWTISMYEALNEFNILTCFHKFININEYPKTDNLGYCINRWKDGHIE